MIERSTRLCTAAAGSCSNIAMLCVSTIEVETKGASKARRDGGIADGIEDCRNILGHARHWIEDDTNTRVLTSVVIVTNKKALHIRGQVADKKYTSHNQQHFDRLLLRLLPFGDHQSSSLQDAIWIVHSSNEPTVDES